MGYAYLQTQLAMPCVYSFLSSFFLQIFGAVNVAEFRAHRHSAAI